MDEDSLDELVAAYVEDREWDARRDSVVKTSQVIRDVTSEILDSGSIGKQELTALYRLCMNNSTYPVSSKRGEIDELDIPGEVKQSLKDRIDEQIGTVGGLLFPIDVPEGKEKTVTEFFETLFEADESDVLDAAVQQLADIDLPKVECGKISP